ncbi:MAG TPA: ATP synthase F1 subunit epsilon [Planctomycetota bacterium]|nr:ATP synthase F1 subunit epsilon [Planctomycetota bacterium]
MARELLCTITTPERKVFEGPVESVVVPAVDGELGILPRHAPLVAVLGYGELRLDVPGQGKVRYFLDGGFVQVLRGHVIILAARAEAASSIDRAASEARLSELRAAPPPKGAPFETRDAWMRELSVLRSRLATASRG